MRIVEMRQKRAALFEQARAILDKAEAEKRDLTGEEREQYDRIMADIDALKADIDRLERAEQVAKELASKTEPTDTSRSEQRNVPLVATPEYREAFLGWVRGQDLTPEQRKLLSAARASIDSRALATVPGAAGGYLVPEGFYRQLIEAMKPWGGMREVATVITTASGNPLPIPTTNDTVNKGRRIAENAATTTTDFAFGQKILGAYKYTSDTVLVSIELLQDSAFDLEAKLAQWLGTRIGRITNEEFTLGTGTDMPEGIVTAAYLGKQGAAGQTTSVTYEDLVDLEHAVNRAYRRNAKWMMADSTLKALKKLKDSMGRPLWQPGLAVREPDTIMGYPYVINDDVPAMAASAKSILFGDFSNYFIRDVMDVVVFRISEKYIENGQIGFVAFSRHDGRLIDAGTHPVVYYQNAAA